MDAIFLGLPVFCPRQASIIFRLERGKHFCGKKTGAKFALSQNFADILSPFISVIFFLSVLCAYFLCDLCGQLFHIKRLTAKGAKFFAKKRKENFRQ